MGDEALFASDGVLDASASESVVPFSLTLQWLESNPGNWPSTEKALMALVRSFCEVEVSVSPARVASALAEAGCFSSGKLLCSPSEAERRLAEKGLSRATRVVAWRTASVLEARSGGEPEEIAAHCNKVAFRSRPAAVVEELEAKGFVEIDGETDEVRYDERLIMAWRAKPIQGNFARNAILAALVAVLAGPAMATLMGWW